MIPSDMATGTQSELEEERRLFYVALTRAKEGLFVYFPLRAYASRTGRGRKHSYNQLTRFLIREAKALMQQLVVYDQDESPRVVGSMSGSSESVDELIQSLLDD
jgi:superfamily I DNA/RNA helicase